MSEQSLVVANATQVAIELAHPPLLAQEPVSLPTPEQARLADGVFTKNQESDLVMGMLGLQTAALLLHDVAVETFTTDEDDPKRKLRNPGLPKPLPEG